MRMEKGKKKGEGASACRFPNLGKEGEGGGKGEHMSRLRASNLHAEGKEKRERAKFLSLVTGIEGERGVEVAPDASLLFAQEAREKKKEERQEERRLVLLPKRRKRKGARASNVFLSSKGGEGKGESGDTLHGISKK